MIRVMAFFAPAIVMPHDTGPEWESSSFFAHHPEVVEVARCYHVRLQVACLMTPASYAARRNIHSIASEAAHCWWRKMRMPG